MTTHVSNTKLNGQILSGVLRAAGLPSATAGQTTQEIVNKVYSGNGGTGSTITTSNAASVATAAAVGAGATDGTGNSRAAELASILATIAAGDAKVQTAVGLNVIKAIAVSTPDGATKVAQNIAVAEGATNATAGATLAGQLVKGVAGPAAGAATAGVVKAVTPIGSEVSISAAAIKANTKATQNIAQEVSNLTQVADAEAFGLSLATATGSARSPAVAAGVAVTLGAATESVGGVTVSKAANLTKNIVSIPANQASAIKIAQAVATAVDVEQIANVATSVAGILNNATKAKLTAASALASALAKVIETKPGVTWSNREDELGELAASIVSGVIGKSSVAGKTDAQNAALENKLISAIGNAIIKAMGTKLYPNVEKANGVLADLSDEVRDVAGSIAQAISVAATNGAFTAGVQAALLSPTGTLATALAKSAGKKYAAEISGSTGAFNDVSSLFTVGGTEASKIVTHGAHTEPIGTNGQADVSLPNGVYEIGSVVDDETPAKNI